MRGQTLKEGILRKREKHVLHLVLRPLHRRWPRWSKGYRNRSLQVLQGEVDPSRLGPRHEDRHRDLQLFASSGELRARLDHEGPVYQSWRDRGEE